MTGLFLEHLSLYNFKNYLEVSLDFNSPVVCFTGNNGSGKTNLLDAIYYLSTCKSYFNPVDSQNINFGQEQCSITGDFRKNGQHEQVICAIRKNHRKVIKRNFKEYEKLADHIGLFPSVLITPYDIELIWEGSEVRRKFLDTTIAQISRSYLDQLVRYNHALLQRNNVLKSLGKSAKGGDDLLEPWDFQITALAGDIHQARRDFLEKFGREFSTIYHQISGAAEQVGLRYRSDLHEHNMDDLLRMNAGRDRILERTTAGIHRDDIEFLIGDNPLKKFASQGQQKTYLFALKLAQYNLVSEHLGIPPLLMLDDLFDKIDERRMTYILDWLSGLTGQIFITDTHEQRIPDILTARGISNEVWRVESGKVARIR